MFEGRLVLDSRLALGLSLALLLCGGLASCTEKNSQEEDILPDADLDAVEMTADGDVDADASVCSEGLNKHFTRIFFWYLREP